MKRILIATLLLMVLLTSMTGIAFATNHDFWFNIEPTGKSFDYEIQSKSDNEQRYYVTLRGIVTDASVDVSHQKLYFNSRRYSTKYTKVADPVLFVNVSDDMSSQSDNESYYSSANIQEGTDMILIGERGTLSSSSPYYYGGFLSAYGRWAP